HAVADYDGRVLRLSSDRLAWSVLAQRGDRLHTVPRGPGFGMQGNKSPRVVSPVSGGCCTSLCA
ncbi:MAG: hypothetical protein ACPIOQ_38720, partial [Promethearchaeia archaeon]